MRKRILVVEDEPDVARLLDFHLRAAGYDVAVADSVAAARAQLRAEPPVVIVLDVMLPDGDGFALCRNLRADPDTAAVGIVMLTARADPDDRITGLEVGADDYVAKPFVVREVVLRVTALVNRLGERAQPSGGGPLRLGPLTIDLVEHAVTADGATLALRPLEFKLLATLAATPGKVFTRDDLLGEVWDIHGNVTTRTVDVHVRRLRQSLGDAADWIETVHGFGYRARKDAPAA